MANLVNKKPYSERCCVVIFYKQKANKPTITWSDAVDEALCFGRIDSIKKSWMKKAQFSFSLNANQKVLGQK